MSINNFGTPNNLSLPISGKNIERNDTVKFTGRHIYLSVDICGDEGGNCESVPTITVATSDRKRREVFSNLGSLHSVARLGDINHEHTRERKKRSESTDGLLKAGGKLLDRSPDGFFIEMLKTIVKPVYN